MIRRRVLGTCTDGIVAGVEDVDCGVEEVEDLEDLEDLEAVAALEALQVVEDVEEQSSSTLRDGILAGSIYDHTCVEHCVKDFHIVRKYSG